jgi:hypothetical protein
MANETTKTSNRERRRRVKTLRKMSWPGHYPKQKENVPINDIMNSLKLIVYWVMIHFGHEPRNTKFIKRNNACRLPFLGQRKILTRYL